MPVEEHLAALAEPVGELFAVVGQHLVRDTEALQRLGKRLAHSPAGGLPDHTSDHRVARVVIDSVDDLGFAAIGKQDTADDVQLPQLHRYRTFPPDVILATATARCHPMQPVPIQDAVHRHPRWNRPGATVAAQLDRDPPGTPPRMLSAQFAHRCLDFGRGLMRTHGRPMRPVLQPSQPVLGIASQPRMHALAGNPKFRGDLHDPVIGLDRQHGPVSLLDNRHVC
jgi:hypothetical protein